MRKLVAAILASLVVLSSSMGSKAASIAIDIINPNQIEISMSGTLIGPLSEAVSNGVLYIATPALPGKTATSVIGDLSVGSSPITQSFVGFSNGPWGDEIQLRSGLNGANGFQVGDALSGTGIITILDHGLTQPIFDGQGAEIYWKGNPSVLQGYATSPAVVPLPPALSLLLVGLGGLSLLARRRGIAR